MIRRHRLLHVAICECCAVPSLTMSLSSMASPSNTASLTTRRGVVEMHARDAEPVRSTPGLPTRGLLALAPGKLCRPSLCSSTWPRQSAESSGTSTIELAAHSVYACKSCFDVHSRANLNHPAVFSPPPPSTFSSTLAPEHRQT